MKRNVFIAYLVIIHIALLVLFEAAIGVFDADDKIRLEELREDESATPEEKQLHAANRNLTGVSKVFQLKGPHGDPFARVGVNESGDPISVSVHPPDENFEWSLSAWESGLGIDLEPGWRPMLSIRDDGSTNRDPLSDRWVYLMDLDADGIFDHKSSNSPSGAFRERLVVTELPQQRTWSDADGVSRADYFDLEGTRRISTSHAKSSDQVDIVYYASDGQSVRTETLTIDEWADVAWQKVAVEADW